MLDAKLLEQCSEIAKNDGLGGTFHLVFFPGARATHPGPLKAWGCTLIEGGNFVWGQDPNEAMQLALDEKQPIPTHKVKQ